MELVIDPLKREEMKARWEELFRDRLFSSERVFMALGSDERNKCVCIDQGLWLWKSIAEDTFGSHFKPCEALFKLRKSLIWSQGFKINDNMIDKDECKLVEQMIFPEGPNEGEACEEKIKSFEALSMVAKFLASWEKQNIPEGYSVMPWKIGAYATNETTGGVSNCWHYDLDMAENVIFFMINLNGESEKNLGGTYFLSNSDSLLLSSRSGYISTPLSYRSKSLKSINWTECNINPIYTQAKAGRVVAFMPSRSLHKGEYGAKNWRKNLHISVSIAPSESRISKTCMPQQITNSVKIGDLSMSDRVIISANPQMDITGTSPYLDMKKQ